MHAEDEPDENVIPLIQAAMTYLDNAGIASPASLEENELYNLCVKSLTLHWFDHRDSVGNEAELPIGLRPIINQLKLCNIANK